jgi:hypothetical protein
VKKRLLLLFTAGSVIIGAAANLVLATSVEVPVAGLNGYYNPDTTHAVGTYTVSFNPSDVLSARFKITGHLVWPSYYGCPGGNTDVNGYKFFANMSTTSGDWFTDVVYVDQRVSFATYLDWDPSGGATWEFLSGGSGTVVLSGFSRPLPAGCSYDHGSSDATAEVIDAKIIFELRDPSPVGISTWGRIKSVFLTD